MASPSWSTPAGSIGTYIEATVVSYTLSAIASSASNTLTYTLLNGNLPSGLTMATTGVISGILADVNTDTVSEFTVRVTETSGTTVIGLVDRTFTMLVQGPDAPSFNSSQPNLSALYILDSTWQSLQVLVTNPDPNTTAEVTLESGSLPPGLEIDITGLIKGYATPPTVTDVMGNATSTFTLKVTSDSGSSTGTFSITVKNQEKVAGYLGARAPAILNYQPLTLVINKSDPYYSYYFDGISVGRFNQDSGFIFKLIGYNFDAATGSGDPYNDDITYIVSLSSAAPAPIFNSLVSDGNGKYGWINGKLAHVGSDVNAYSFTVKAARTSNPALVSDTLTFSVTVVGDIDDTIIWPTNSISTATTYTNLGVINNGAISDLAVTATFGTGVTDGSYRLAVGSTLPAGLQLLSDGSISGRVDFLTTYGDYSFVVEAYSPHYPEVSSTREFRLTVVEKYTTPYDDIYMKALLVAEDKNRIDSLLTYIQTTQVSNIYRLTDPFFGVAKDIRYQHMFGVPGVSILNPNNSVDDSYFYTLYTQAIQDNFYWRHITMGDLKTAVAKDNDGNIIYEVVYCQLVDDLVNTSGKSISKEVVWPRHISRTTAPPPPPSDEYRSVYPNSLPNMRQQIAQMLGQINDANLLPRWMDSQQPDGNVLGFVPCWVLCYTKPGTSTSVLASITNYLATNTAAAAPLRSLNQISFELDRFEIDRSATYTWGQINAGQWPPGTSSASVTNDSKDSYIFFPRKTIIAP